MPRRAKTRRPFSSSDPCVLCRGRAILADIYPIDSIVSGRTKRYNNWRPACRVTKRQNDAVRYALRPPLVVGLQQTRLATRPIGCTHCTNPKIIVLKIICAHGRRYVMTEVNVYHNTFCRYDATVYENEISQFFAWFDKFFIQVQYIFVAL